MKAKNSIKVNSVIYMIRNIMNIIFPLITFKYAAVIIKADGVGAVNYASAIVSYFGLIAQLGINTFAISEGSKLRNDDNKFEKFVNSMFTLNIISTVVSYVCLFIAICVTSKLREYRLLIMIYSLTIIATTISMEWLFIVLERFTYITVRSIIFQLISLGLLFVFVTKKTDIVCYAFLSVFASSGSSILNFIYVNKIVHLQIAGLKNIKQYIKPVLTIWISNVASLIYINADTIIIGWIKGDYEVGCYSAATKIVKAICVPITTICTVSAPALAENIIKDKDYVNELVGDIVNFLFFLIFPCMIGVFLLAKEGILFMSGKDFLLGVTAEKILALDIFLSPINGFMVNQILVPAKKENVSMIAMVGAAIGNIILDILLIPMLGINGAAIATIAAEGIVLILCIQCVKKIVNLQMVFKYMYKYLIASLVIIPIYYLMKKSQSHYILFTFSTVLISIIAYLILVRMIVKEKIY